MYYVHLNMEIKLIFVISFCIRYAQMNKFRNVSNILDQQLNLGL